MSIGFPEAEKGTQRERETWMRERNIDDLQPVQALIWGSNPQAFVTR